MKLRCDGPLSSFAFNFKSRRYNTAACCAVLFNTSFEQVVSADQSGCVCTWDVMTGAIDFRFLEAHGMAIMVDPGLTCVMLPARPCGYPG